MIFEKEPIEMLGLPIGTENALIAQGIETVEELIEYELARIDNFKGIGEVGIRAIKCAFKQRGVEINDFWASIKSQGGL